MNLGDFIGRRARMHGDKLAVVDGDRSITFREFDDRSNQFARMLLASGLSPGDRVAVFLGNRLEFFDAAYGLPKAGLVRVFVSHRLTSAELRFQLTDSAAAAVIVSEELLPIVEGCELPADFTVIVTGDNYEAELASMPDERVCIELQPDAPCALVYTSGTSGRPRGAIQTHENWYWYTIGHLIHVGMRPDDRILIAGPLVFSGRGNSYSALFTGATQYVLRDFDAATVIDAVERFGITTTTLVPTMIYLILEQLEEGKHDLSTLRGITYGGSPMSPDCLRRCLDHFGPIFTQTYGLTEVPGGATYLDRADHVPGSARLSSVGRAAFGMECVIMDDQGEIQPPEVTGEICLRGPNVFSGYWRDDALTAERIVGGWFHTGDIGYLDKSGYLFLRDRKSDMIITGGHNVYPREVEEVLLQHPAVSEAAVVPQPDERWGEAVTGVVRLHDGMQVTADELVQFCKGTLAGYKVPRAFVFSPTALPTNANGKLLRRSLRDDLGQAPPR